MTQKELLYQKLEEIKTKFQNGTSLRQLEEEYGINRKMISKTLKENGCTIQRGYSDELKEKAISLYKSGKDVSSIAKELNVERHQLNLNLVKWGVKEQQYKTDVTDDPLAYEILEKYQKGKSIQSLATEYHRSTNYIYRIINFFKASETNRVYKKYNYNENIFEKIDTEEKAYWLGFLYTDGCVYLNRENRYTIEIGLKSDDLDHIKKFAHFICPDYDDDKIKISEFKSYHNDNVYEKAVFKFSCKKMALDLIKAGCTQRKTFTLEFPTIDILPQELYPHFMRGVFDGDGSVYDNDGQLYFNYVSASYDFIFSYNVILNGLGITNQCRKIVQCDNYYRIDYGGNKQLKRFFDFFYTDATVYLKRKYDKFIAVLGRNA